MTLPGLDDLEAEQRELQELVRDLADDDWLRPTPSWGWDVRDTIAHLADTDDVAVATMTGRVGSLGDRARSSASSEDVTYRGVLTGRKLRGREVLGWWEESAERERAVLADLDPQTRVPWGIGMKPRSFVTARLMETWAHGLDVHAALGRPATDTDRLTHVAWLATRALPYAYSVAGGEPPAGALRVELTLPSGQVWADGPSDAPNVIRGPAGQYCRVFVQRLRSADATGLVAYGEAAESALRVARAFL